MAVAVPTASSSLCSKAFTRTLPVELPVPAKLATVSLAGMFTATAAPTAVSPPHAKPEALERVALLVLA